MTSAGDVAPAEQLCYIPCTFCNIVLAVGVPCSSMFDMVTVRCGHCTKLWSVNMAAAAFHSLSTSASSSRPPTAADLLLQAPTSTDYGVDLGSSSSSRCFSNKIPTETMPLAAADRRVVNRPPEKRQRVPSAYNQFIKEEIRRIKANNPEISHREAFSTAAKNWAHFPHIHFGLMLESNKDSSKQDGAGDEWN